MKLDSTTSAVVTGAASGLGAATARALAGLGVKVAIFDLNDAKGEPLARELGTVFCKGDVTDEASVDAAFARARATNGQERVLVNCAGTAVAFKTASRAKDTGEIRSFPLAAFDSIIQVNLVGTFRCVVKSTAGMLALPPLDDGERGAIVNTILAGIFDTPLLQGAPPNVREALAASVPFPRRFGAPEEYASLAIEILRNRYINGEDIRIDGAIRMAAR